MKNTLYYTAIIFILSFSSCDIKKNNKETDPKTEFVKIYENNNFADAYIPLDIQQNADGSYIHMAKIRIPESSFYGVYIMKTDAFGTFEKEEYLSSDFVNPSGSLMKSGTDFYFFTMNSLTLASRLMKITTDGTVSEVATIAGASYPLYAALNNTETSFILQHYNRDDKKTVVSLIDFSGNISNQQEFDIGFGDFDVEEPIIDHLTGNGKKLPFLCGETDAGNYFFNGFYNYTLSTVFFSFGSNSLGLLQGYKDERCISGMLYLGSGKFALARYAYGENYFAPYIEINKAPGAISGISSIKGNNMLELNPDASVIIKRMTLNGKEIILYNTDTKSGQIALYFYDAISGSLLGTKYIGYANPYKSGNVMATEDGGLAITGTVHITGRFPRIAFVKIDKDEVNEIVN